MITTFERKIIRLKQMMNGVLEDQKTKKNEDDLVEEDWMKKPKEEMTDEEISKYEEFLIRQIRIKEEKEKSKKIMNQELKKIIGDIEKLYLEFDNRLSLFLIKKLEYQYRVQEQELSFLMIQYSIFKNKKIKTNKLNIENKINQIQDQLEKQQKLILNLDNIKVFLDDKSINIESEISKLESKTLKQIFQNLIPSKEDNIKKQTEFESRLEKYTIENEFICLSSKNSNYKSVRDFIFKELEYNYKFHQEFVKELISKKNDDQNFIEMELQKFNKILNFKKSLIEKNKEKEYISKELEFNKMQNSSISESLSILNKEIELINKQLIINQKDIYILVRLSSENIEIKKKDSFTLNPNTLIIPINKIYTINKIINNNGLKKQKLMSNNFEEKRIVERDLKNLKKLEFEIQAAMVESLILSRLKISKKIQKIVNNKDLKLTDHEEKNIKNQISKLIASTEKIISSYKGKENSIKKEITFISRENTDLVYQGSILQESVSQRQEIFNMVFGNTNNDINQTIDPKIKKSKFDDKAYAQTISLIQNKKLYDTAKRLSDEIESLMKELKILQKRTFPYIN